MFVRSDPRYRVTDVLARRGSRVVHAAEDGLTGRSVVLKHQAFGDAVRELRTLLALPDSVGPRVVDVVWTGRKRLTIVLERLRGQALGGGFGSLPADQLPSLAVDVCRCLIHLDRLGYVHTDLKPENLFRQEDGHVRLLDFGFAFSRFAGSEETPVGGTPPFWAPELSEGWIIDPRTDLFSLGKTLEALAPAAARDSRWQPILKSLAAYQPHRRHQHAAALQNEIVDVFGLPPADPAVPVFGSGPFQGRAQAVAELLDLVRNQAGGPILVQARAGTGLSRFLREAVLAIAAGNGPPTRIIDLSGMDEAELARATGFLRRWPRTDQALLCGVSDPSPGLRWVPSGCGRILRRFLRESARTRLELPPLDAETCADLASMAVGSPDPAARQVARRLHEEADADLVVLARTFQDIFTTHGHSDGVAWSLGQVPGLPLPGKGQARPFPPRWLDLEPEGRLALRLLARLGFSFDAAFAKHFLKRFGRGASLPRLRACGLLVSSGKDRLRFTTNRLLREALADSAGAPEAVDRWLNEHQEPDLNDIRDLLHIVDRAHRLGDKRKEARILSAALDRAVVDGRRDDVIRLLALPGRPPASWSAEAATRRVRSLARHLGPPWTPGRLLFVAGEAIRMMDQEVGLELLKRAAAEADSMASVDALVRLAELSSTDLKTNSYRSWTDALRARDLSAGPLNGVLAFLDARRASRVGDASRALELAREAANRLRGSGHLFETLSLHFIWDLQAETDPRAAIEPLTRALEIERDPERFAQMAYNLALMHEDLGEYDAAGACIGRALRTAPGRVSGARTVNLRIERAWVWASLDRIDAALAEAQVLLPLAYGRLSRHRAAPLRLLIGHCHLHRGNGPAAVREVLQAVADAAAGPMDARWICAQYLADTVLELETWAVLDEEDLQFPDQPEGPGSLGKTTRARIDALRASHRGAHTEAVARLEACRPALDRVSNCVARARYLHHLGLAHVRMDPARARGRSAIEAERLFRMELDELPEHGAGYWRGRAHLFLGLAQRALGKRGASEITLKTAAGLATRIRSRRLLAECLLALSQAG